jgi:hypothetical protein
MIPRTSTLMFSHKQSQSRRKTFLSIWRDLVPPETTWLIYPTDLLPCAKNRPSHPALPCIPIRSQMQHLLTCGPVYSHKASERPSIPCSLLVRDKSTVDPSSEAIKLINFVARQRQGHYNLSLGCKTVYLVAWLCRGFLGVGTAEWNNNGFVGGAHASPE